MCGTFVLVYSDVNESSSLLITTLARYVRGAI